MTGQPPTGVSSGSRQPDGARAIPQATGLDSRIPDSWAPWIPIGLALVTLLVFAPALRNGFVDWDDNYLLVDNPEYRGLGWHHIRWMFTTALLTHYTPLSWLTFGADYVLWGMNPAGYHLTSVLLHAANAVLFYFVALRLLGAATGLPTTTLRGGAALAALFFAIHPLRVESVAWVTERRGVLSGFFFLLAILLYLAASTAESRRRPRLLAAAVGAYLLALASKATVMALPLLLMLLDVYPLRRLPALGWFRPEGRRLWIEKAPFFALTLVSMATAYHAAAASGALLSGPRYPATTRLTVTAYGLCFYMLETALPIGLSPLYELPVHVDPLAPRFLAAIVGVIGLSTAFVLARRFWPAGLAAWLGYAIAAAPVIGLVQAGMQLVATRFSYLPCLAWALLVGAGAVFVQRARVQGAIRPALARAAVGVAAIGLLALGAQTWQGVQVWRDTGSLFRAALVHDPDCSVCEANLGVWLVRQGSPLSGLNHLLRAAALRGDRKMTHGRLGWAYATLGMYPEAAREYRHELAQRPGALDIRTALAEALVSGGRPQEAVPELERVLRAAPDRAEAHTTLGFALLHLGRPAEGLAHFERALQLAPDAPRARLGLADAAWALGRSAPARRFDGPDSASGAPRLSQ